MLGRLRRSEEFERVRAQGRRWRGKRLALNAAPAESNAVETRIGYIASKSLGNAVQRNRARRLMREAARSLQEIIPPGWDVVLIAQPAMVQENAQMQQVREELLWLMNKANIKRSPLNPTQALPAHGTPSSTKA
jgi:ribonuclease P protein component